LPLVVIALLVSCGRPLTPSEADFIQSLQGPSFDPTTVRLYDDLAQAAPRSIPTRPRLTCQERLYPAPDGPTIQVQTQAMTIFRSVYFGPDVYAEDFVAGWPDRLPLPYAMLLAHEMVHVWQWQNRALTGYHPLKAVFEHIRSADPYLFDTDTETRFLDFGYEQQGSIMEEYVCCRTLAPDAPRTQRLHELLSQVFEPQTLETPLAREILLPWRGVQIEGICD
jgi:hypothetical protein